jgi:hypothetical protein
MLIARKKNISEQEAGKCKFLFDTLTKKKSKKDVWSLQLFAFSKDKRVHFVGFIENLKISGSETFLFQS